MPIKSTLAALKLLHPEGLDHILQLGRVCLDQVVSDVADFTLAPSGILDMFLCSLPNGTGRFTDITGLPTFLFTDYTGILIHQVPGGAVPRFTLLPLASCTSGARTRLRLAGLSHQYLLDLETSLLNYLNPSFTHVADGKYDFKLHPSNKTNPSLTRVAKGDICLIQSKVKSHYSKYCLVLQVISATTALIRVSGRETEYSIFNLVPVFRPKPSVEKVEGESIRPIEDIKAQAANDGDLLE